jgi:hypothetical protein
MYPAFPTICSMQSTEQQREVTAEAGRMSDERLLSALLLSTV